MSDKDWAFKAFAKRAKAKKAEGLSKMVDGPQALGETDVFGGGDRAVRTFDPVAEDAKNRAELGMPLPSEIEREKRDKIRALQSELWSRGILRSTERFPGARPGAVPFDQEAYERNKRRRDAVDAAAKRMGLKPDLVAIEPLKDFQAAAGRRSPGPAVRTRDAAAKRGADVMQKERVRALRESAEKTGRVPLTLRNFETMVREWEKDDAAGRPRQAVVPGYEPSMFGLAPYTPGKLHEGIGTADKLRAEQAEDALLSMGYETYAVPAFRTKDDRGEQVVVPIGSMAERHPRTPGHPGYFLSSMPEAAARAKALESGGFGGSDSEGPKAVSYSRLKQAALEGVSPAFIDESTAEWANRWFNPAMAAAGGVELAARLGGAIPEMLTTDPDATAKALRDTAVAKGAPGGAHMLFQRAADIIPEGGAGLRQYMEEKGVEGFLRDTGIMKVGSGLPFGLSDSELGSNADPSTWDWMTKVFSSTYDEIPHLVMAPIKLLEGTLSSGDLRRDIKEYVAPGAAGWLGLLAESVSDPQARAEKGGLTALMDMMIVKGIATGALKEMARRSPTLRAKGSTVGATGRKGEPTLEFMSYTDSARRLHTQKRKAKEDLSRAEEQLEILGSLKNDSMQGLAAYDAALGTLEGAQKALKRVNNAISEHALNSGLAENLTQIFKVWANPTVLPTEAYRLLVQRGLLGRGGASGARWLALSKQDRLPEGVWEIMQESRSELAAKEIAFHQALGAIPRAKQRDVMQMLQMQHALHADEGLRIFSPNPADNLVTVRRPLTGNPEWVLTQKGKERLGLSDAEAEIFAKGGKVEAHPDATVMKERALAQPHMKTANRYGRGLAGQLADLELELKNLGLFYNPEELMAIWAHDSYKTGRMSQFGRALAGNLPSEKGATFGAEVGRRLSGARKAIKGESPIDAVVPPPTTDAGKRLKAGTVDGSGLRDAELRRLAKQEAEGIDPKTGRPIPFEDLKYKIESRERVMGLEKNPWNFFARGLMQMTADVQFLKMMREIRNTPGLSLSPEQWTKLAASNPVAARGYIMAPRDFIIPSSATKARFTREKWKERAIAKELERNQNAITPEQLAKAESDVQLLKDTLEKRVRDLGESPLDVIPALVEYAAGDSASQMMPAARQGVSKARAALDRATKMETALHRANEKLFGVSEDLTRLSDSIQYELVKALGGGEAANAEITALISSRRPGLVQAEQLAEAVERIKRVKKDEAAVLEAASNFLDRARVRLRDKGEVLPAELAKMEKRVIASRNINDWDKVLDMIERRGNQLEGAAGKLRELLAGEHMDLVEQAVARTLKKDPAQIHISQDVWARVKQNRNVVRRQKDGVKAAESELKKYNRIIKGRMARAQEARGSEIHVEVVEGAKARAVAGYKQAKAYAKIAADALKLVGLEEKAAAMRAGNSRAHQNIPRLEQALAKQKQVVEATSGGRKMGDLAGRMVQEDVMYELLAARKLVDDMATFSQKLNSLWKIGKTAWSIATTARNGLTNALLFAPMAGISLLNPATWPAYAQAIRDLSVPVAKRSKQWRQAYETGRLRSDQITNEMRASDFGLQPIRGLAGNIDDMLANMPSILMEGTFRAMTNNWKGAFKDLNLPVGVAKQLAKAGKSWMAAPGKFYGAMDEVFRLAYFNHKKPKTRAEAARIGDEFAEKFIDYSAVPGWVRVVNSGFVPPATKRDPRAWAGIKQGSPLPRVGIEPGMGAGKLAFATYLFAGQPFISFVAQSIPMFMKWAEKNPLRGSMYQTIFDSMMDMQYAAVGMDRDREEDRLLSVPGYDKMSSMLMGWLSAGKTKGDLTESGLRKFRLVHNPGLNLLGPYSGGVDLSGNPADVIQSLGAHFLDQGPPAAKLLEELTRNRSKFTDAPLSPSGRLIRPEEKGTGLAGYIAKQLLPPDLPDIAEAFSTVDLGPELNEAKSRMMNAMTDGEAPIELADQPKLELMGSTTARKKRTGLDARGRRVDPQQEALRQLTGVKTSSLTVDDSFYNVARRHQQEVGDAVRAIDKTRRGRPEERYKGEEMYEPTMRALMRRWDEAGITDSLEMELAPLVVRKPDPEWSMGQSPEVRRFAERTLARIPEDERPLMPPPALRGEYDESETSFEALDVLDAIKEYRRSKREGDDPVGAFIDMVTSINRGMSKVRKRRADIIRAGGD